MSHNIVPKDTTAANRADLVARFAALRATEPRIRVRDAALRLGASEGELASRLPGAVMLRPDWTSLLHGLSAAGEVMALTRNEHCVHERHGRYEEVSVSGQMGLVLGPDIDLRLFLSRWRHAVFVPAGQPGSPRGSIQVFDAAGMALHKVFATEATPEGALERLAAGLADPDAHPIEAETLPPKPAPRPDAEVDAEALREGWAALRDTHEFFPLLRRCHATRQQAFRLAGPRWAERVAKDAVQVALSAAARQEVPVMIFVGNPGCIQIHSGTVRNLVPMGPWFNVLDPRFNLHLRADAIASAWLVRKPTEDGIVTSIEVFDAEEELILMLFGLRKPGQPEDPAWRALAEGAARA
ncbi:MAG: ChuX/HutX family heme-like substrate-binding protein [Rhodovarius sp.]|nr:ChuX/HutX family heme-like substrate-binding protein [Rhodovarius sp.]